jgi:hypothetical protein
MRLRDLIGFLALSLVAISLAGVLALSQTPPETAPSPPPAAKDKQESAKGEDQPLRIVRWVCNDRICGGCDGQCSRHGHVATHKDGHCACTPKEGSPLDEAVRKAFAGHEKGR